jgi:hypothetical protein
MRVDDKGRNGEMRSAFNILIRNLEGKTSHRRLKRKWWNNIKLTFKKLWFEDMNSIHLTQNRVY